MASVKMTTEVAPLIMCIYLLFTQSSFYSSRWNAIFAGIYMSHSFLQKGLLTVKSLQYWFAQLQKVSSTALTNAFRRGFKLS